MDEAGTGCATCWPRAQELGARRGAHGAENPPCSCPRGTLPPASGDGGQGGAVGRAFGSCKFQLLANWMLGVTQVRVLPVHQAPSLAGAQEGGSGLFSTLSSCVPGTADLRIFLRRGRKGVWLTLLQTRLSPLCSREGNCLVQSFAMWKPSSEQRAGVGGPRAKVTMVGGSRQHAEVAQRELLSAPSPPTPDI